MTAEATPRDDARLRICIGDIQGCADELDALLDAIHFDPACHHVIAVGDIVNRGPASARSLRRMIEIGADSVLGNHDLHLLARSVGQRPHRDDDTFDDVLTAEDSDEMLDWLWQRPLLIGFDDLLVVHAGIHPGWSDPESEVATAEEQILRRELPLKHPALQFATRVRYCDAKGNRPADDQQPGEGFHPWDHFYRGARTVAFGHWSQRGLVHGERVRGLDTGCVWGGSLTAWLVEEDRFVSVAARRQYCAFT